jgi:hypothetical protein
VFGVDTDLGCTERRPMAATWALQLARAGGTKPVD